MSGNCNHGRAADVPAATIGAILSKGAELLTMIFNPPPCATAFSPEEVHMRRSTITFTATVASLLLAACGQKGSSTPTTSAPGNASSSVIRPAGTRDAAILAAAEPFEKLTETAFSATPEVLDVTIGEVTDATRRVRGSLSGDASPKLDEHLAAVTAARRSNNRADLAIASVEGYRVLVSAVSSDAKVPMAVNLLDYAGFRYDADLNANPARWADMTQAAAFGNKQWASISPRVTDAALRARVDQVLAEMSAAAGAHNVAAGAAAAKLELALVDDLETFFNKH